MTNNKLGLGKVIVVGMLAFSALGASAEVGANAGVDLNASTSIEARKKELEAKRDELNVQVGAKRVDLIKSYGTQMMKVHQAAIDRLTKLADRLGSRLTKIETEKNITLTVAKQKLVDARAKIVIAQTYQNGLGAKIDTATSTNADPKAAFAAVRALFDVSRENLKVAHQALVDVLTSIKIDVKGSATSTTP